MPFPELAPFRPKSQEDLRVLYDSLFLGEKVGDWITPYDLIHKSFHLHGLGHAIFRKDHKWISFFSMLLGSSFYLTMSECKFALKVVPHDSCLPLHPNPMPPPAGRHSQPWYQLACPQDIVFCPGESGFINGVSPWTEEIILVLDYTEGKVAGQPHFDALQRAYPLDKIKREQDKLCMLPGVLGQARAEVKKL